MLIGSFTYRLTTRGGLLRPLEATDGACWVLVAPSIDALRDTCSSPWLSGLWTSGRGKVEKLAHEDEFFFGLVETAISESKACEVDTR